jgi:hypothetical protein
MADIRPMSFGEILDASLKLYIHNFGLFLRLAIAALAVPAALLIYFMMFKMQEFVASAPMMMAGMVDWSMVGFMIVIGIAYALGSLMLTAAAIRVISDSYLGRATTFGQAIGLGASKIWPLLVVGFAKGLLLAILAIIFGAALALVFATILSAASMTVATLVTLGLALLACWVWAWVASGYGVTTPVVALEQLRSAFDAFGRSWELTRGARAKLVGLAIVSFLLFNLIPQIVIQMIAGMVMPSSPEAGMALMVASYVIPVILYPAISCVFTLMYYDLRVRREAFDLQMLSQRLGV